MSGQDRQRERVGRHDHERSHIPAGKVALCGAALLLSLGAILVAIAGFASLLGDKPAHTSPDVEAAVTPSPIDDLRVLRERLERRQRAELQRLGWMDRKRGVAQIPIEDAMQIIAQRGLPAHDPQQWQQLSNVQGQLPGTVQSPSQPQPDAPPAKEPSP